MVVQQGVISTCYGQDLAVFRDIVPEQIGLAGVAEKWSTWDWEKIPTDGFYSRIPTRRPRLREGQCKAMAGKCRKGGVKCDSRCHQDSKCPCQNMHDPGASTSQVVVPLVSMQN